MFMTPGSVLGNWFRGLLSIGILVGAGLLLHRWYDSLPSSVVETRTTDGNVTEIHRPLSAIERISIWRPDWDRLTAMLGGALVLLIWSFSGRFLNVRLLRKADPRGQPRLHPATAVSLQRPDGTILHLETQGAVTAQTVILTHGWGMHRGAWAYLARDWQNQFRLVLWDLPGLGKSSRPKNRDYSLEKMAHDLKAVVDASGAQPVILMGHSIGGMIILTFCRLYPELLGSRVSKLVLVHTSFKNPVETIALHTLLSALQKPLIEPLLVLQIVLSPVLWLMNWLSYLNGSAHQSTTRTGFAGQESREQLDFVTSFFPRASPAVLARGSFGMLRYDATETLKQITIPVLVFTGDLDPVTLPQAGQKIAETVPQGQIQMLAPAKHFGMIEHNAKFAKAAAVFCNSSSM
ncbi:alpha/beta fold hydrolase [Planctomicrobium piriforme]|uniref:Pimeloyl-ACP methyl ester carboxylesterase n=1 Tax=Planctomicrobium piriforme TaxID=1576369 RepID=A0A1I3E7Z2_9PLAN|nr:alpha/beta hydrolase [Planctomicrobium piriforme]SFH95074.1 Pimeloyl-ACP methyl ester carboxylesterase [Planctomicrobium piriforme]